MDLLHFSFLFSFLLYISAVRKEKILERVQTTLGLLILLLFSFFFKPLQEVLSTCVRAVHETEGKLINEVLNC